MSDNPAVLNHFGHCVSDLDASARFYCELFGFELRKRMEVPDDAASALLGIERPVGLTAVYLDKGPTTLELLSFDRPGNPPARRRPFTEPGLTHISFCVPDLQATARRAVELGGSVEETSTTPSALIIRDPDGQAIELIDLAYRSALF